LRDLPWHATEEMGAGAMKHATAVCCLGLRVEGSTRWASRVSEPLDLAVT